MPIIAAIFAELPGSRTGGLIPIICIIFASLPGSINGNVNWVIVSSK
jgi:hypothetical protein